MKLPVKARIRRAASGAALAALALTATGCAAINDQATTYQYDPSDGVSAHVGDVSIQNLMLVTNGADQQARYIGTILNKGDASADLTLEFGSSSVDTSVEAGNKMRLEDDKYASTFTVPGDTNKEADKGTYPGQQVLVTFKSGGNSTTAKVPVVDGTLPEYADYVPGGHDSSRSDHLKPSQKAEHGH